MISPQEKPAAPPDLITSLNGVLLITLTGINQYFLHARMLKHKGFMALADYEYKQSLDTMKYTDQLVNLVLTQGGLPNMQDLGKLRIGESVPQMLVGDLALAEAAIAMLNNVLKHGAQPVLSAMLAGEKRHIEFLRGELKRIDSVGINTYLQTQA